MKTLNGEEHQVPFGAALALETVSITEGTVIARLPYREELVGNPDTGVLHGGAITALLDHASGAAVRFALREPDVIATLDLRIDYTRPATPGKDVYCAAFCYKVTHSVAFTRATAYHEDPDDPLASSVGTFMLGTFAVPGANQ